MSTYRVDKEIGRGGMAIVYAGWHEELERPVALKVLREDLARDNEFRARFLREARIAARLHHPHLVRTYDIAELDGLPCIVMELVRGGTADGGRLTREEAAQVADALSYAHARGVVHRDLKPANLLRSSAGVKIADFGIARAVEDTQVTQVGTVLGTLRYLAPEQAEGRAVGPEADVYSLGVVLDELLESPTPADRELIARCRARDPHARPSAAEVAAALAGATVVAPTRVLVRTDRRPVVAVAVLATLLVVLVVVLATGGSSTPARVRPVPHSANAAQEARNLRAWLLDYSR